MCRCLLNATEVKKQALFAKISAGKGAAIGAGAGRFAHFFADAAEDATDQAFGTCRAAAAAKQARARFAPACGGT